MGKTITTHLLDGTPKGIQSLQISNKTIMSFVIPRADINKSKELLDELSSSPCLYILFEDNEDIKPKAYIGQTDDFFERVSHHNKNKDFWTKVIVFISPAGTLNKADILYLEYLAINQAKKSNTFNIEENKQEPKKPKLQRHITDTMNDFFEDIKFITSFTNYNIFKSSVSINSTKELFYTTKRKSDAQGFFDGNGFTVLKGSIIASDIVNSFEPLKEKRLNLIEEYTKNENNKIVLISDYTFSSPSTAADFCTGSSNNGWTTWKNKNGKTLDEVYRK